VVSMNQVQEFLDARRLRFVNPETFQNARRALIARHKTAVLAHFETLLQSRDEEQRASAIEGLALQPRTFRSTLTTASLTRHDTLTCHIPRSVTDRRRRWICGRA
jgi:hypothetical protein